MSDCRSCKSWKECTTPDRDWFSYGEITWCKYQVFWLLKWEEYLGIGIWPTPESTAEAPKRTISKDAQYVNPMVVMAELRTRLEKTGLKGDLLRDQCKLREKVLYLSNPAKDALYYCSGWKRKDRSFSQWLKDRRYHQKSDKSIAQVGIDR
jgi:hypothetical protein